MIVYIKFGGKMKSITNCKRYQLFSVINNENGGSDELFSY